jgi:hypothetical protein
VFGLASLAFAATAVIHLVRGLDPGPDDDSSPARHFVFVGINLALAVGLQLRPRWLWAPLAALVVQQLHGHGGKALEAWRAKGELSLEDLLVVLFMPTLLGLVVWEATSAKAAGPRGGGLAAQKTS